MRHRRRAAEVDADVVLQLIEAICPNREERANPLHPGNWLRAVPRQHTQDAEDECGSRERILPLGTRHATDDFETDQEPHDDERHAAFGRRNQTLHPRQYGRQEFHNSISSRLTNFANRYLKKVANLRARFQSRRVAGE